MSEMERRNNGELNLHLDNGYKRIQEIVRKIKTQCQVVAQTKQTEKFFNQILK